MTPVPTMLRLPQSLVLLTFRVTMPSLVLATASTMAVRREYWAWAAGVRQSRAAVTTTTMAQRNADWVMRGFILSAARLPPAGVMIPEEARGFADRSRERGALVG